MYPGESGFSFERVAQSNLEWIFSKLDSGFKSLVGFRILSAGFRIRKHRIPDSTSKKFLDSVIRIPLHGAIVLCFLSQGKILEILTGNFRHLLFTIVFYMQHISLDCLSPSLVVNAGKPRVQMSVISGHDYACWIMGKTRMFGQFNKVTFRLINKRKNCGFNCCCK